jgi:hypothetical protein
MLRMARRYLYFEEDKLVSIKNHLAASMRELKLLRDDWRDEGWRTSSKKKVRVHSAQNMTIACMEPSRVQFKTAGEEVVYYVSLRPVDANTLLRDVKDVLLKIRLSKRNKKKNFGHSDKK